MKISVQNGKVIGFVPKSKIVSGVSHMINGMSVIIIGETETAFIVRFK